MENNLQIFSNPEFGQVRMIEVDGKPYFMASDVAKALGYIRPNDAVKQHCRATVKHRTPISGKIQEVSFIPEGDVYRLIVRSKLPSAEKFESWVFDEVLPSIRKHGGYIQGQESMSNEELLSKALLFAQRKIEAKDAEITKLNQKIHDDKPRVNFANRVSSAYHNDLVNMGQMAKLLEDKHIPIGRNRLFDVLKEMSILMADNLPYQRFITSGYFKVKEYTYDTAYGVRAGRVTLITGKGQVWLSKQLQEKYAAAV